MMDLKDFETVFHLCVVFNFVYAAVENFSIRISLFFSSPFKNIAARTLNKFSIKIQKIKDSEIIRTGKLKKLETLLDNRFLQLSNIINNFLDPNKYDLEYNSKFKSLYLITGFFSFFLLVISGFDKYLYSEKIYHSVFIIDCLIIIFFIIVFVSSFIECKAFRPLYTLLIFLFFTCIFIASYVFDKTFFKLPNAYCSISFAVALVISPFFLHFLRVIIQLLRIYIFVWYIEIVFHKKINQISHTVIDINNAKDLLRENGINVD